MANKLLHININNSFDLHKICLYRFYIPLLQLQLQMISITEGHVLEILVAQVFLDQFICLCT